MNLSQKSILWTRSQADWLEDKMLFTGAHCPVIELPCIDIRPLPYRIEPNNYKSFIFTSPKAVNFAIKDKILLDKLNNAISIYTFGDVTASLLARLGLKAIQPLNIINAADLSGWLTGVLGSNHRHQPTLILGPKKPSYNMQQHLDSAGIKVDYLPLYETIKITNISKRKKMQLISELSGVVCFASPSACEGFSTMLCPRENRLTKSLKAIAIGSTTAQKCRQFFQRVAIAAEPRVESLAKTALSLIS